MFQKEPPNFTFIRTLDEDTENDSDSTDLSKILGSKKIDLFDKLPPKRKPQTHELMHTFRSWNIKNVQFLFNGNDEVTLVDKTKGSVTLIKKNDNWFWDDFRIGEDWEVAYWFKDQDNTHIALCGNLNDDMNDAVDPIELRKKLKENKLCHNQNK